MAGPRAAGGRPQRPAQPGRRAGGRARLHPLLPGRGVLSAPGTSPSVCFNVPEPPESKPGFVSFTFLCTVGFWKALFLQKAQIIIPRPLLGACIRAWGPPARFFAAGFPGGAVGRAPHAPDV